MERPKAEDSGGAFQPWPSSIGGTFIGQFEITHHGPNLTLYETEIEPKEFRMSSRQPET